MKFELYMEDTVNAIIPYTHEELIEFRDKITKEDLASLISEQKYLLSVPLQTIVNNKKVVSPNKHIYESLSIYSWPNPDTEDGLPYIIRDGYINHDHIKNDKENLRMISFLTYHIGILYFLTKEKVYYDFLKKQLTSFFIDEKTKMLPDMRHGQSRPGMDEGCAGGIIDIAISFGYSLSILHALNLEGMLEEELVEPLKEWMSELLVWLKTHPFGKEMAARTNNHSLVYDYFTLIISRFINDDKMIANIQDRFTKAVLNQIAEDGKMPQEMSRKKARSYTMMNSKLLFEIYKFSNVKASSEVLAKINKAVDFYLPYASGVKEWEYEQTQFYYQFYDINYIFAINKYFNYNKEINMTEKEIQTGKWTYLLNKSVVDIRKKE